MSTRIDLRRAGARGAHTDQGSDCERCEPASGDWTGFTPPEEAPFGYRGYGAITALAADPFGRLWVAELLCDGASCDSHALYLVRDGIWNLLSGGEDWIQQLRTVTDAAGRNWLFANIIYRLAEAGLEPGATLRPQSVAVDAAGRVWFLAWDYPTWNLESSRTRRAGPAYVVCSKLRR